MKKTILLINPWIYDFAAYDLWIAPLGLLYIASFLRNNGYAVQIIDCLTSPPLGTLPSGKQPRRFPSGHGKFFKESIEKPLILKGIPRKYNRYGIHPETFRKSLRDCLHPDLIFVTSMMTYWYPAVFDMINILKQEIPGVPIILGGNYVTLCHDHALKSGADLTISGEGEPQIPRLLKDMLGDECYFIIDINDLDSYPYPAFDLRARREQISLLTSRGCPFRCNYCASHLLSSRYRRRNPIKVVDEIEYWYRSFGIKHFSFYDDALLVDPDEMAIPLFREIIKRDFACHFHCPNGLHLREITAELSRLMFRAGVKTLRFGFETSDIRRQLETGGKVNNEHLQLAIAYLTEAGYRPQDIGIYLLSGMPGQSAAEVFETISYVKRCGARPIIAEYSPIPGTVLWDAAVKASPYPISAEPLFHNNSMLPCQNEDFSYEMYQECKKRSRTS